MSNYAEHYTVMPIPAIEAHTRYFEAGAISIGVEYRLLNEAIVNRHLDSQENRREIDANVNDRGVSLHVFGADETGARRELLRFDCFDDGPHYHYVDWARRSNDVVHLDPVANGDSLDWALQCIRTRLPQMLERAGASSLARSIDPAALDAVLPRVSEAAYRARYEHDDAAIMKQALADAPRQTA